MNKKIYIKELNEEELKKVFKNNKQIQQISFEKAYEDNMFWQEELGNIFFGKTFFEYLEIRDNYSSFYLKIKNPVKLFENLSLSNKDYLQTEESQKYIKYYKQAKKYYNYYNNCNYESDNFYKNFELLENTLIKIVAILEKELHLLEDVSEEDALTSFIYDVTENDFLESAYILNKQDFVLYEDVSYTKKYN